jgi:metal-responsive CopG/Arc/MetJ family transcriptional regulator
MAPPNPSTQHGKLEFKAPKALRDELDRVAYEQSEPGNTVSRSDVLREAARRYVVMHDEDPAQISPKSRGALVDGDAIDS